MRISPDDTALFIEVYQDLLGFVGGRLGGISGITDYDSFCDAAMAAKGDCRDALYERIDLLGCYVSENPRGWPEDVLEIIAGWKRFVRGRFVVERHLKRHTVFLTEGPDARAYGVLGLTQEIPDLLLRPLPCIVEAVLLPWKGVIICDGLIVSSSILLGGGISRDLAHTYSSIKAEHGIITSLELGAEPERAKPAGARAAVSRSRMRKFLKDCPLTVAEFRAEHGEPDAQYVGGSAEAHAVWRPDGDLAVNADQVLVYKGLLRGCVLEIYASKGQITGVHVATRSG